MDSTMWPLLRTGRRLSLVDSEVVGSHFCQSGRSEKAEQREAYETEHGRVGKIRVDSNRLRRGDI